MLNRGQIQLNGSFAGEAMDRNAGFGFTGRAVDFDGAVFDVDQPAQLGAIRQIKAGGRTTPDASRVGFGPGTELGSDVGVTHFRSRNEQEP